MAMTNFNASLASPTSTSPLKNLGIGPHSQESSEFEDSYRKKKWLFQFFTESGLVPRKWKPNREDIETQSSDLVKWKITFAVFTSNTPE
ncbi:hypothetical protein Nepgr_011621 [Nepenthes gracilis]|uniref:Uncharacterized protein n=1 Tax=Nepenthes gracilis TaxID=150966 RepID=A0AAD3XMI1_NEPGR|nr:hypothetical protein Nepgr_011621 [Nepenthes gracilis]